MGELLGVVVAVELVEGLREQGCGGRQVALVADPGQRVVVAAELALSRDGVARQHLDRPRVE